MLWCAITVVLLSLNGLVFYHNTRTLVDNNRSVSHAQDVLSSLEGILTMLDDAETGQRGYIITGKDSYLKPYQAALSGIDPQVARLEALVAGNPDEQLRLPSLKALIAARLAEAQLAIDLRRTASPEAARREVLSDRGQTIMTALRDVIATMKATELNLLNQRAAESRNAEQVTMVTLVVATAADIALLGGLFVLIGRGIARTAQQLEERERLISQEQAARATAEAAVRMRDTFLSLASHELKTPLTTLMGSAQLLQTLFSRHEGVTARDLRLLQLVRQQGERLKVLIDQLLDTSRLQTGQLAIHPVSLDLAALVHRVVEEAQLMTKRHSLQLHGADEPLVISGDSVRLDQVLHNLLNNAIKYSPDGGPITIVVARQDPMARIAVTDAGIGIPQAAQSNLFERFYRANNVTSEGSISGLGIGLYVVREIITLHGGTVEVSSTEGRGSTFTISLPVGMVPDPLLPC